MDYEFRLMYNKYVKMIKLSLIKGYINIKIIKIIIIIFIVFYKLI